MIIVNKNCFFKIDCAEVRLKSYQNQESKIIKTYSMFSVFLAIDKVSSLEESLENVAEDASNPMKTISKKMTKINMTNGNYYYCLETAEQLLKNFMLNDLELV